MTCYKILGFRCEWPPFDCVKGVIILNVISVNKKTKLNSLCYDINRFSDSMKTYKSIA